MKKIIKMKIQTTKILNYSGSYLNRKSTIISTSSILLLITTFLIYKSNNSIEVTHYTIEDKLIPLSFNDTVIVHISDLHNKEFGANQKGITRNNK